MLENIKVLCHSSIKFEKGQIIYFDPFKINENYNDADIIFITHSHYDHFSEEDILKVKKEDTKIVITEDLYDRSTELGFGKENILPTTVHAMSRLKRYGRTGITTSGYFDKKALQTYNQVTNELLERIK